jgi:hypothetical protein
MDGIGSARVIVRLSWAYGSFNMSISLIRVSLGFLGFLGVLVRDPDHCSVRFWVSKRAL